MNRIIKWISLAIMLTALLFCVSAMAETGGTDGNISWTLSDNGTLTISGTGAMKNYSKDSDFSAPWGNTAKKVVIESGVTSIGSYAFYNCSSLMSISIPESVTSIGDLAFCNCSSLSDFYISSIESWLLINHADYFAHPNNGGSESCHLYIDDSEVTSITIPPTITSIDDYAFQNFSSVTSITIPDSVTSIGYGAFYNCSSLTNITIPDSVTSIGEAAFHNCSSLTNITIPDGVTSIGGRAFYDCSSLTSITIPDSVTSIGVETFCNCSSLTSITILDGVTNIEAFAFYNCSSLTNITIPDSVTRIEAFAFHNCSSLTSITIPDNVICIQPGAFNRCSAQIYASLDSEGAKALSVAGYSFYIPGANYILKYVYSDQEITGLELESADSDVVLAMIPDGVTSIGCRAFYNCRNLTSITLPDEMAVIGDEAFYNCSSLTSITIPENVTSIGNLAFYDCGSLQKVAFLNDKCTFGSSVFEWPYPTIYCYEFSDVDYWATANGYSVVYLDEVDIDELRTVALPAEIRIAVGNTVNIDAVVFPWDSSLTINWSNSDPDVVSYDDGKVTALTIGTSTLTASVGNASDSMIISVIQPAESFSVSPDEAWVVAKSTIPLSITNVVPEGSEAIVSWSSGNETYATVDSEGLVTTKKPGLVTISADSQEGVHAECTLHICYPVKSIAFVNTDYTVFSGDTLQLKTNVTTRTDEAVYENKLVSFTSSDESILTVDEKGMVTGISVGTATVTASANNGTHADVTASVSISVICKNHSEVTDPAGDPTCEETGLTQGSHCGICGLVLIPQQEVSALGHLWGEPTYTWSEDNGKGTAARVCSRDSTHVETETVDTVSAVTREATCEVDGETTYTATFTNAAFTQQTKAVNNIPALEHDWMEITYVWADDHSSVTATRMCRNASEHIETETKPASLAVYKSPTQTEIGSYGWISEAFENSAFEIQVIDGLEIPALDNMDVLRLPANLTEIEEDAFVGLACEAVIVPDGCNHIGSGAFADCPNLLYILIPENTTVESDAFSRSGLVIVDRH